MWRRVEEAAAAAIGKYVHVILSKFNYPIYPHFIQNSFFNKGTSINDVRRFSAIYLPKYHV